MSVNESASEQLEDAADLPDLYNRELLRKKNSYINGTNGSDGGGYSDWKARNGMNTSERMMSSLGKAIHNQGIISTSDKELHERNHYIGTYANSLPGEYNVKDQHNVRLNASEPCYSPQQFRGRQHSGEMVYRNADQSYAREEIHERQTGRMYNGSSRENSESELIPELQYNPKCTGQCCTNKTNKSPMNSPQNRQGTQRNREPTVHNRNFNNPKIPHGDYHYQNADVQNHNSLINQSPPCRMPNQYHHNFMYSQCQLPQPTCHCCQNQNEMSRPTVSPHKKCTVSKKTEASIKKLFRILWLQNEQLGLLERQVSKLIEVNFTHESNEKSSDKVIPEEKSANVENVSKQIETREVGVMTDLPCLKCSMNEKKTSSESEPEISNSQKPPFEESLTLFGVDIPVNGEENSSPPVSMHIDMQEFQDSSSSETDESDTSEDEREPVGWTFYDNVVGQVNNILKSASNKKSKKKPGYSEEMMAAIEQLKRLGIPLPEPEINNAKRVTFEQGLKEQQINLRAQSEISMNFNALASKYLSSAGAKVQDISMCNVISSNTNMSMATMRYLERHQIANRDEMTALPRKSPGLKPRTSKHSGEKAVSKFLDITAIRQQPKLLPKDI